jgi:phosphate:Na+ symporter
LLYDYIGVANYFESMGDLVDVDLGHAGERRLQLGVRISPATQQALQRLGDKVVWSLETAIAALDRRDNELALQIIEAKAEINELAEDAAQQVTKRLVAEEPRRTETFQIESELIEQLKRIYYFTKRIAKLLVERDKLKERSPSAHEGAAA